MTSFIARIATLTWLLTPAVLAAPASAEGPVSPAATPVSVDGRVPLTTATPAQLSVLPSLSPSLAQAIVDLRTRRGGLQSFEELRILPGMTEAALDSLRTNTSLTLSFQVGQPKTFSSADEVLAEFGHEPEVQRVLDEASAYAKVQPALIDRWLRSSRAFAALPTLRLAYQLDDDYSNQFRRYDEFGNPPTTTDGTFYDVQTDADVGQGRTIDIQATWELDKLVMSSEQIRVINEAQDIAKLREKVLAEVTRIYFERRRLQVEGLLRPKTDLLAQVKDELRLRELTANLDAYTGGWFSESVAAGKR
jgi:hypothetical protein